MGFTGAIKAGGGFLNNVDGVIESYEFTTVPPGGGKEGEWVYFVPSILIDGADEAVTQHFFMGGADRYDISVTGQIVSCENGVTIGAKTPAGRLFASLVAAGFPEDELPNLEDGDDLDLSCLNDRRFRFVQEKDEEGTAKLGKRKDKKTKKEYDRTNTVVSKYYGDAAPAKPVKGKGKPAEVKKGGKPAKSKDDDLDEEAEAILIDVLGDNDNSLDRGKLSLALTKKIMKNPNREALKKLINSDDFLERENGWSYDAKGKRQTISVE